MNTRLNNGEHFRLPDGREFHLCDRVEAKRIGRVVEDGRLVTVSVDDAELRKCPTIPYLERTFSYDSRSKQGMIWRTMKRLIEH
ncbi:MAG: hypothetical protein JW818_16270 [Pirellulales bacterium]|nr:hypothetical protein [Pirellulales bacterium]